MTIRDPSYCLLLIRQCATHRGNMTSTDVGPALLSLAPPLLGPCGGLNSHRPVCICGCHLSNCIKPCINDNIFADHVMKIGGTCLTMYTLPDDIPSRLNIAFTIALLIKVKVKGQLQSYIAILSSQ